MTEDVAMAEGHEFEEEVRRVARELWPEARFSGASMIDGQERDGVFETEWITHIVEATTSLKKNKAEDDIAKLTRLRSKLVRSGRQVQAWFVTAQAPTADQRSCAPKDGSVRVVSYDQFRSQLIDAFGYLADRDRYPFGSAHDPDTGSAVTEEEYVPVSLQPANGGAPLSISDLADAVDACSRLVLTGDYGVGKSMTLRELFRVLSSRFRSDTSRRFPILLNLRDHYGQDDAAEALERHGRKVGLKDPTQLVRAWRAGWADLLLDGFDEMAAPGLSGPVLRMSEIRRRSVSLVRLLVNECPPSAAVAVAGRAYYFDTTAELRSALGLTVNLQDLEIGAFSDEQVANYAKKHGWPTGLPAWLPTRPLLLAYLASRGFLEQVMEVGSQVDPAMAWDELLGLVCEREARIEGNVDGLTLRTVVERLATLARSRVDRLGPLDYSDIEQAFRDVTGRSPDDRALVILQRLPGLGIADPSVGSRRFVDSDLADAAAAGDLVRFIEDPYQ